MCLTEVKSLDSKLQHKHANKPMVGRTGLLASLTANTVRTVW